MAVLDTIAGSALETADESRRACAPLPVGRAAGRRGGVVLTRLRGWYSSSDGENERLRGCCRCSSSKSDGSSPASSESWATEEDLVRLAGGPGIEESSSRSLLIVLRIPRGRPRRYQSVAMTIVLEAYLNPTHPDYDWNIATLLQETRRRRS